MTGSLWVLQEALRDRTPFGGFPWGRLAFSQGDSPLLGLAALGGAPLVTFGAAVVGGLVALRGPCVEHRDAAVRMERGTAGRGRAWSSRCVATAGAAAVAARPRRTRPSESRSCRATCRGSGSTSTPSGGRCSTTTSTPRSSWPVEVDAGAAEQPDLVVWPENASDIDPLRNADARERIDEAARAIGVPILVGGLLDGPGPMDLRNVGIVWEPGSGPGQSYIKRHPVPFAEYMPIRSFVRTITDKVDLVRPDFVAGETPGVLIDRTGDDRRRHLLRGRLRRGGAGHRHRRRAAARRADQQRDLQRGRGAASSWPWCDCGRSSTAGRR